MAVTTLSSHSIFSSLQRTHDFRIMNYLQISQLEVNIFVSPTSNLFPLSGYLKHKLEASLMNQVGITMCWYYTYPE